LSASAPESQGTYRLSLTAPQAVAAEASDLISETCVNADGEPPAIAISEVPGSTDWRLDAYFEQNPDLTAIEQALSVQIASLPAINVEHLPPTDWVALVQQGLSPVNAGRFLVYGSHDRHIALQRPGDIEIEAGQAFGTAHHATTRGCLLALDNLFKARRFHRILDLGTGSGLLAIACARVLRQRVRASDIDPVACRVAQENADLNEVGRMLQVVLADGLRHPKLRVGGPYDLLIANILAAPLKQMAPDIANSVSPGGYTILSGLLTEQSPSIEARFRAFGFVLHKRIDLNGWATLTLRRSATSRHVACA
jgi:ribosomal protein L11 methyltransferase